jgi:hypothetical protein
MVWVVELIRSMPSDHLPKTNDMGSRHEIGTSRVKVPRHLHVLILISFIWEFVIFIFLKSLFFPFLFCFLIPKAISWLFIIIRSKIK